MSKKKLGKVIVAIVLAAALGLTGVAQPVLAKFVKTVTGGMSLSQFAVNLLNNSFSLLVENVKEAYGRNETFQHPTVTVKYTDGRANRVLTADQYEISEVDMSRPGIKTATVTYEEDGKVVTSSFSFKVNAVASIMAEPTQSMYNINTELKKEHFKVTAVTNEGKATEVTDFTISDDVDMSTPGDKTVTITYMDGDALIEAKCTIKVMNLTLLTGDKAHEQYWFFDGNFNVSCPMSAWEYYAYYTTPESGYVYNAPNGETVYGFDVSWDAEEPVVSNGGATTTGLSAIPGEKRYDLTIDNAVPYTTLGINCITGYDVPMLGFGYYIDNDVTTLKYNAPGLLYNESNPGLSGNPDFPYFTDYVGMNGAHAVTYFTCYDFEPGKSYTVNWVVVFADGIQKLSEWTVNMKPASDEDKVFTDTDKPNVNVIIMAGQSNMFGASPITDHVRANYGSGDYTNVKIHYANINFNEQNTLTTYFSNTGFDTYQLGIGGQGDSYFGPETALAKILAVTDGLKEQEWYIIKYAAAGTALTSQWMNGCVLDGRSTTLTADMINYVQAAIDELSEDYDVQVRSFMWMQGESDAISADWASLYAQNEKILVERVRQAFSGYATRAASAASVPGSGISFINAGIAINDTDLTYAQGGPNDWVYAETVNAAKVSNCQWVCSTVANQNNLVLSTGPLAGISFADINGQYVPTVANPNQSGVIVNSIYMDTHMFLSKLNASDEHSQYAEGDRTDWAHYSAVSMIDLGGLFVSGMHYLITQNG